ncbi:predicted protein [Lichtheimia corymbifera JMRC:FSU:9682]|uniref:Choice-of-anchor A domain-containing protein n=1 Tax=Lichtheimia corymbifera JMRC:FSU:9682 TaxID=1263082 RepID=A0A068RVU2_9FUNG|nr:predicted protein [Lichtheimia corymbifera JMRC:FSU:9682]
MKFLGISIYAAALLAYTQGLPGNRWHHHKDRYEEDVEEIHYQVVTETPPPINETITEVPTSGVALVADDGESCPAIGDSLLGEEIRHFTGIFFGDFTTGGTGQDILGPLAVGGNFHAPNYIVNANHDINCAADETSSFGSVGLVVGGDSTTSNTHLRGDNLIAGNGDAGQYDQQLAGCRVYTDEGTGHFDFPQSIQEANDLSQQLASLPANRVLDPGGVVTALAGGDNGGIHVFQLNTCGTVYCGSSTPDEIFFGNGNWNGPSGDVPAYTDTVIFNVPVTTGSTITLSSNAPTFGFNNCKTVYNFYPVDENGDFYPDGDFTIERKTGSQFEGLVLAPRAHIRDGNTGNFAGTVIGLDYNWLDQSAGVEIHDWAAAGCPNFNGCLPKGKVPTPTDSATEPTATNTDSVTEPTATNTDSVTEPTATNTDSVTEPTATNTEPSEPTGTLYIVAEEKEWGHYKGKGKGKKQGHKGSKDHKKHGWKEGHKHEDKKW